MMLFIFTCALAFYLAWNLGANDVANSMGTSVGSKAVTLRQALIIAGVLEFTGAVLFGQRVSATLVTGVIDSSQFAPKPFLIGMISVLIACGLWLQIATMLKLPVASSHAVVGALAGVGWVAIGSEVVNWQAIGVISGTWILTPVISGTIAALVYSLIQRGILTRPNPIQQMYEWIPWLSMALVGIFGVIVLPSILPPDRLAALPFPDHDVPLLLGAAAIGGLTLFNWRQLSTRIHNQFSNQSHPADPALTGDCLENREIVERVMARFQLVSACFVAFAHGSNDVGNAIAPLAAIDFIQRTGAVPTTGLSIPLWILVLGGLGIVSGLAILGKNVIQTIGEGIIALQPSGGFCAEIAAATTILIASRAGLPVSTSHALVGGVVGVGLVRRFQAADTHSADIQVRTIAKIALVWVVTIPFAGGLAAALFAIARLFQL